MIEIATSISCQKNLLKTGIGLRGLVAYFLSWAFPCKQQVQVKDPQEAEGRSRRRAAERRKRRSELLENAVKDKMLDELGETIEEIPLSEEEGLDENLEKDWATDAEQAKSEIEDEREHRSIVSKQRWTLELRQWI